MKPKRRRLLLVTTGFGIVALSTALVLTALDEGVAYFYTPSELATAEGISGQAIRLGGLVEEGSVVRGQGISVSFRVTDLERSLPVAYEGILPDLFRDGQGVVVMGRLRADGTMEASEVLAKHDETYMPAEVAEALKESGHWEEDTTQ